MQTQAAWLQSLCTFPTTLQGLGSRKAGQVKTQAPVSKAQGRNYGGLLLSVSFFFFQPPCINQTALPQKKKRKRKKERKKKKKKIVKKFLFWKVKENPAQLIEKREGDQSWYSHCLPDTKKTVKYLGPRGIPAVTRLHQPRLRKPREGIKRALSITKALLVTKKRRNASPSVKPVEVTTDYRPLLSPKTLLGSIPSRPVLGPSTQPCCFFFHAACSDLTLQCPILQQCGTSVAKAPSLRTTRPNKAPEFKFITLAQPLAAEKWKPQLCSGHCPFSGTQVSHS